MSGSRQWLRVIVEGGVIVGSILLAFGIDAAWAERGESRWEVEQLALIEREFEANLEHSSRVGLVHANTAESLTQIRDWARSVPAGTSRRVPATQARLLIQWRTSEFSLGALEALVSSGDLGRLGSSELQLELLNWRTGLDDVREKESLAQTFVEQVITPTLLGAGFLSAAYDARAPFAQPPAEEREDVLVVASPELIDLLSARIAHVRLAAVSQENLVEVANRVLALLSAT